MQQGSFTPLTSRFDTEGVVERMNNTANIFRKAGDKVVFIRHDGTRDNEFIPGSDQWVILPSLIQQPGDLYIEKTANDCFYSSELERVLRELCVNDIMVSGCATDFCVDSTIRSALSKDFNVTVIADAHTTADKPYLDAQKIIQHHNHVWQNMIPTKGKIQVVSFSDFILSATL